MSESFKIALLVAVCFLTMLFTTRSCLIEKSAIRHGVYKEKNKGAKRL